MRSGLRALPHSLRLWAGLARGHVGRRSSALGRGARPALLCGFAHAVKLTNRDTRESTTGQRCFTGIRPGKTWASQAAACLVVPESARVPRVGLCEQLHRKFNRVRMHASASSGSQFLPRRETGPATSAIAMPSSAFPKQPGVRRIRDLQCKRVDIPSQRAS